MKMDLYSDFIALADTGSFSKAAEQLSISQSTLTLHIKQLEEKLGVTLFDRSTRKVSLSECGQLFLPHARKVVNLSLEARSALSKQQSSQHYDISIGFYPSAARYNIFDWIRPFQNEYPDISVQYREHLPPTLRKHMEQGEFDFTVLEESHTQSNDGYDRICLDRDTLVAVLPATHPLAEYDEALLSQLSKESFLMMPENTFVYTLAMESCKAKGFTPSITYTSFSISSILEMVGRGDGVSMLMKAPVMKYKSSDVAVIELNPSRSSCVNLLYRKDKLNDCGKKFLEFLRRNTELGHSG